MAASSVIGIIDGKVVLKSGRRLKRGSKLPNYGWSEPEAVFFMTAAWPSGAFYA